MRLKTTPRLITLGLLCCIFFAHSAGAKNKEAQDTASAGHANGKGAEDKTTKPDPSKGDAKDSGTSSHIQVVYAPTDIIAGSSCESRITPLSVRATANNLSLTGPVIVGGGLQDKDSPSSQLPAQAFQLFSKGGTQCGAYTEIKGDSLPKITEDLSRSPVYIGLSDNWLYPGSYTGTLWIAAKEDSGAQAVTLKVLIRPWYAWVWGVVAIFIGAVLSWFAVVYVVRQRQMAANQVLIARLANLLDGLDGILRQIGDSGAPNPSQTLAHIQEIRDIRLRELLNDKELSVLAGITVPPTGTVTVIDEIESVNQIVHNGFSKLLDLWNTSPAGQSQLKSLFGDMDGLGAATQPLIGLDQKIQGILNKAPGAVAHVLGQPLADLPSEDVVIHRVVATTYMLDVLSLLSVIVLGTYVLIWKNPGFGSAGNYVEAFLWGLGLKLSGDVTKLGPNDVRTAFGIKIPS